MLNLIASGCGTGKSHFVLHKLLDHYPDVKPEEIVVVTSRALTVDQQGNEDGVTKFRADEKELLNYWNGDERGEHIIEQNTGVHIMTYNRLIYLLDHCNDPDMPTLCNVKILVLDECHTLFSDTFNKELIVVRRWTNDRVKYTDTILIGLTATPGVVLANQTRWGVRINQLTDGVVMRYKAKQLTCANLTAVPGLVRGFTGKTMIMCSSFKQCSELARKIPDSFVLISATNEKQGTFTPEMAWLRDYIVSTSTIPDERWVPDPANEQMGGYWVPLKVLIATSTIREGFNLLESGGVKNIVSCIADEVHVIQVAGRARYDLDNLVVAIPMTRRADTHPHAEYMTQQKMLFSSYMYGDNDGSEWFSHISSIVEHDLSHVRKVIQSKDIDGFRLWLDETWLSTDIDEKWLYRPEDKETIIQQCVDYKVSDKFKSRLTYQGVLKLLPDMGYEVTTGRAVIDNNKITYKVIRRAG